MSEHYSLCLESFRRRLCRSWEHIRYVVGLRIAYVFWTVADALTAVGNWFEDLATARHPLKFRTHWRQRHDVPNGWQR